jgi:5'-3' exonuclease
MDLSTLSTTMVTPAAYLEQIWKSAKTNDSTDEQKMFVRFRPYKLVKEVEPWTSYAQEKTGFPPGPEQDAVVRDMVIKYVEGLCWVLRYYYDGGYLVSNGPM